ncbi:MAG TPA: ribonucleotide reductase, partial [Pseudomonas sp.]|nr:ribonucleotide reductase [Pseudomonas sp.]
DDAGSFVASEGAIRGPFLESAIKQVRAEHPGLHASDMELANAILAEHAVVD